MKKTHILLAVALLLTITLGVASRFWETPPGDTVVDEHLFRLTLPGHWTGEHLFGARDWTYRSDNDREEVKVEVWSFTDREFSENLPWLFPKPARPALPPAAGVSADIILRGSTNRLSADDRFMILEYIIATRQRDAADPFTRISPAQVSSTIFSQSGGLTTARVSGVEPKSRKRFWLLYLCSPSAVTVFDYETFGFTEPEAEAKARAILQSVKVSE